MSLVERLLLTEEQVGAAERREGLFGIHPVILALDEHAGPIARFVDGYFAIKQGRGDETRTKDGYLRSSAGFLVDVCLGAGNYTLEPLDLVAVWSRVMELFPDKPGNQGFYPPYHRHVLSGIIANVHAVYGLSNPAWQQFPRTYLKSLSLSAGVLQDHDGARLVHSRLEAVRYNYGDELDSFLLGSRMGFDVLWNRLHNKDDEEAKKLYEEYINKANRKPLLGEIRENFGHEMMLALLLVGRLASREI